MDHKTQFTKEIFNQNDKQLVFTLKTQLQFLNHWTNLSPQIVYYLLSKEVTNLTSNMLQVCHVTERVNMIYARTMLEKLGLSAVNVAKRGKVYKKSSNPSLKHLSLNKRLNRGLRKSSSIQKVFYDRGNLSGTFHFYKYQNVLLQNRRRFIGIPPFGFLKHRPKPEYLTRLKPLKAPLIGWKWKKRRGRYLAMKRLLSKLLLSKTGTLYNLFSSTKVRVKTRLRRRPYGINRIAEEVTLFLLSRKYLTVQNKAVGAVIPQLYWRGLFLMSFANNLRGRRFRIKQAKTRRRFRRRRTVLKDVPFFYQPLKRSWTYLSEPNQHRKLKNRSWAAEFSSIEAKVLSRCSVSLTPTSKNTTTNTQPLILQFLINKKVLKGLRRRRRRSKWRRNKVTSLDFKKAIFVWNSNWSIGLRFRSTQASTPRIVPTSYNSRASQIHATFFKKYLKFILKNRPLARSLQSSTFLKNTYKFRANQGLASLHVETPTVPLTTLRYKNLLTYHNGLRLRRPYVRQKRLRFRKFRIKRLIRKLSRIKRKKLIRIGWRFIVFTSNISQKSKIKQLKRTTRRRTDLLIRKVGRRMLYSKLRFYKPFISVNAWIKRWARFSPQGVLSKKQSFVTTTTFIRVARGYRPALIPTLYDFNFNRHPSGKKPKFLKWLAARVFYLVTRNVFMQHELVNNNLENWGQWKKGCTPSALLHLFRSTSPKYFITKGASFRKPIRVKPAFKAGELGKFTLSLGGFTLTTPSKKFNLSVRASRYDVHKKNHSFLDANRYKKDLLRRYLSLNARTPFVGYRRVRSWSPSRLFTKAYTSSLSNHHRTNHLDPSSALPWYNTRRAKRLIRPARVRLRPGYIRIWKRARHSFRIIARLKYRYEHRLTRYFAKRAYHVQVAAKRYRSRWSAHPPEYSKSLYIILVRCKFAVDFHLSFLLLESKSVYLNTNLVDNRYMTLLVGDFLQLIVSTKFYVMYRFQQNRLITRKFRILKFARIKFKPKTRRAERDVNHSYPDWVMDYKYNNSDVPSYVEVDFFSLSAYFIPEPLALASEFQYYHEDTPLNPFNMYNWKYTC